MVVNVQTESSRGFWRGVGADGPYDVILVVARGAEQVREQGGRRGTIRERGGFDEVTGAHRVVSLGQS